MLDMSFCWIDPHGGSKLCQDLILHGLVELNLSGNQLEERGATALGHLLAKACCHLKILMINECQLGKIGILKIIQALSDNSFLQDLGLAGNNIMENNSFFNSITGADRCSAESCVQGVVSTPNYLVDCSENRASDCSKQHESPTSAECTSFFHCVSSKQYNNGAKDQKCQSLPTCFEINPSKKRACVGDKSENTNERRLARSCQQCEGSCGEDMADGEEGRENSVNCSSLESDCASSSQPFGLIRDRSHLLLDLHTNENVLIKGEGNTIKISCGEYASDLFIAIQMAENLQLLDLSNNSLPSDMAEQLYVAWSLNRRAGNPIKHINNSVVHFTMEGRQCCGLRRCCQRLI
jgi:hypothetical protein